jgi:hypothetical protein
MHFEQYMVSNHVTEIKARWAWHECIKMRYCPPEAIRLAYYEDLRLCMDAALHGRIATGRISDKATFSPIQGSDGSLMEIFGCPALISSLTCLKALSCSSLDPFATAGSLKVLWMAFLAAGAVAEP